MIRTSQYSFGWTVAEQADQPSLQLGLLPSLRLADVIDLRPRSPPLGFREPPGIAPEG
jgi:hypothetical protein